MVFALVTASFISLAQFDTAKAVTQIVAPTFTGPENGVEAAQNNHWSIGGNQSPCGGYQNQPEMVDTNGDTVVDRLRLTNNSALCETGYALYDLAQTTSAGLDITFNISLNGYGGSSCPSNPSDNYNYESTNGEHTNDSTFCQADGFVFYLKAGTNTDTGAASLGSAGGSLGYAPQLGSSPVPGLSGALLGIGFDAYGNSYHYPFTGTGCSNQNEYTDVFARRSLVLRGAQGANRTTGYCQLTTNNDRLLSNNQNGGVNLANTPVFTSAGATVRIVIDANDSTQGSNGTGYVYIAEISNSPQWTEYAQFELPAELTTSSSFKFGFVAGTGGGTMNSEIWDATVNSIRPVPNPTISSQGTFCVVAGAEQSLQVANGNDGIAPYSFSVASGTLPTGLTLTSSGLLTGSASAIGISQVSISMTDSSADTTDPDPTTISIRVAGECSESLIWEVSGTSGTITQSFDTTVQSILGTSNEPSMSIDESLLDDETAQYTLGAYIDLPENLSSNSLTVSTNGWIRFDTNSENRIRPCETDWRTFDNLVHQEQGIRQRDENLWVKVGSNEFGFIVEWQVREYGSDDSAPVSTCKLVISFGLDGNWLGETFTENLPEYDWGAPFVINGQDVNQISYNTGSASNSSVTAYAANQTSNSVTASNSRSADLQINGNMVQQSTDFSNGSCAESWVEDTSVQVNGVPAPIGVVTPRGKCFRWTFDSTLSESATAPLTENSQPFTNGLTSPTLIVPIEPEFAVPSIVPVDPRLTSGLLPMFHEVNGPDQVMMCIYESESASKMVESTGNTGLPKESPELSFDLGVIGETDSSSTFNGESYLINGDGSSVLNITGNFIGLTNAVSRLKVSSGSLLENSKYVLIRLVPVLTNFASSCNPNSTGLVPSTNATYIVNLKPLAINSRNQVVVPLGRQ